MRRGTRGAGDDFLNIRLGARARARGRRGPRTQQDERALIRSRGGHHMKDSRTSRVLLGAALLIAGVSVAAAQGMQAGSNQRGEAKASAQKSGGQAQTQNK